MTEEIKFEKALERLEKIVEDLENGNIPLEDALKKYEEGVRLSAVCQKRLSQAEKKIEILTKSLDGSLKKEPFDLEENEMSPKGEAKEPRKQKKSATKDADVTDEDLLF